MRHELRVAEEQRELSFNNLKRRGKKVGIIFPRVEYTYRFDSNIICIHICDLLVTGLRRFQCERILYDVRSKLLWNFVYA